MTRIALVICALALLWGCTTNMPVSEQGDPSSERKVLIAAENTEYKRELAAQTIRAAGTADCYFRIVGLDQLEAVDTSPYKAVVLLAGYRMGRLDDRVTRFLEKNQANDKVILFFTRSSDDPLPQNKAPQVRVDAISSASRADQVGPRAEKLALLITSRL